MLVTVSSDIYRVWHGWSSFDQAKYAARTPICPALVRTPKATMADTVATSKLGKAHRVGLLDRTKSEQFECPQEDLKVEFMREVA